MWVRKTTFNDLQGKSHDEVGILKSRDYFNSLVKAETEKGIASSRIVLGLYFCQPMLVSPTC